MEIWQGIVLGAIQGFSEFLPISSSGHLILFQRWFGLPEVPNTFDILLHVATLIPIFIVLFKEIIAIFKKPLNKFWYLVIATIPAAILGVFLDDPIESVFKSGDLLSAILLSVTFLITATELFVAERVQKKTETALPLSYKSSAIMGAAQAFALLPGLSRSGTVICAGTFAKVDRNENANFAFIMSIPVILGALAFKVLKLALGKETLVSVPVWPLILGMLTATIIGYISIKFMLRLIKKVNYKWFSLYLVLISIACIVTKLCGI